MDYLFYPGYDSQFLAHHGIKGQKWGIRRFQNKDGTLTEAGKKRYYNPDGSLTKHGEKAMYDRRGALTQFGKNHYANHNGVEKPRELTPEEKKTRKDKAMVSGNAKDVYAARFEMNNDELKRAIDRIDLDKKISSLASAPEVSKGEIAVKKAMKTLNMAVESWNTIDKAMTAYDKAMKKYFPDPEKQKREKALRNLDYDTVLKNFGSYSSDQLKDMTTRMGYANSIRRAFENATKESNAQQKQKSEKQKVSDTELQKALIKAFDADDKKKGGGK